MTTVASAACCSGVMGRRVSGGIVDVVSAIECITHVVYMSVTELAGFVRSWLHEWVSVPVGVLLLLLLLPLQCASHSHTHAGANGCI